MSYPLTNQIRLNPEICDYFESKLVEQNPVKKSRINHKFTKLIKAYYISLRKLRSLLKMFYNHKTVRRIILPDMLSKAELAVSIDKQNLINFVSENTKYDIRFVLWEKIGNCTYQTDLLVEFKYKVSEMEDDFLYHCPQFNLVIAY